MKNIDRLLQKIFLLELNKIILKSWCSAAITYKKKYSPGFATYVQNLGGDHAYPGLNLRDQQLTEDLYRALGSDALQSTKPLVNTVTNPSFDGFYANGLTYLPYSKGKVT